MMMDGHDDVITAKNEAELDFNDPNETLPTQNFHSIPLVALFAVVAWRTTRVDIFPDGTGSASGHNPRRSLGGTRDVFRSIIHAGAADLAAAL